MTEPHRHQEQPDAASPLHSVWVSAHAGSGKTHVLTNRVIRLLLAEVEAHHILCLTFTKAAAAEMTDRLHKQLGEWTTLPDDQLSQKIEELGEPIPNAAQLNLARQLFARILETSQGLRIQTIHAFCQSVLKRFPLEAGISPSFRVMDDRAAQEMMAAAQNRVLAAANQKKDPLKTIVRDMNDAVFANIFAEIIGEKHELEKLLPDYKNKISALAKHWRLKPDDDYENLRQRIVSERDDVLLRQAAVALQASNKSTDCERGAAIHQQLQQQDPRAYLERYIQIFLTKNNEPRKTLLTKHCENNNPNIKKILLDEQARVFDLIEKSNGARALRLADAIASLAADFLKVFSHLKSERNFLDYDDLITKTRQLFITQPAGLWVLYKLDGLNHILIDEAQDTNPEQWDLIKCLTEEFFAGQDEDSKQRTLFAVGDPKQSIFGFQGVVPDGFQSMQEFFSQKAQEAEKNWADIKLTRSFRSVPEILKLVDQVFTQPKTEMDTNTPLEPHIAYRNHERGLTEIWPTFENDPDSDPAERLAHTIATKISDLAPDGKGAGDILILVRRRNIFVDHLIRALKERGLPVAGSDRLQLTEHLAVMDMISLAKFVLLPQDDLSLAEVLKSPLGNLSEDELMKLALARIKPGGKDSLWAELCRQKEAYPRLHSFLSDVLRRADFVPVFEFFSEILEAQNMRAHFAAALGAEAHDPLDEFLNLALAYEQTQAPSLQGFIHWLARAHVEVKRDMERGHDEIRIMTVHGAKGLEAKIVFLADIPPHNPPHHWMPIADAPFWRMSDMPIQAVQEIREQNKIQEAYEENRLLYVAMTRARDQLYVCGYHQKGDSALRWLPLIAPCAQIKDPPKIKQKKTRPATHAQQNKKTTSIPAKIKIAARVKQKRLSPSNFSPEKKPQTSVSLLTPAAQKTAALAGSLMHEALRYAPQMNKEKLTPLLQRLFPQNSQEECHDMARLTHELIAHRELAFCFEQGAGEVAVEALFEDQSPPLVISGRIDRMIFNEKNHTAQIIDYKTDKNPPDQTEPMPAHYRKQLAAYRAVIQKMRPDWEVSAALLWTRIPRLDWADNNKLDNDAKMIISNG